MRFGSLFAGIGGFDLGLERAGMECAWQVEWDDYCTTILEKHWPHVPRYRDVRDVSASTLEAVDVICGGFPCQPLSQAGKREAQADHRWLWPEYARLVDAIRPRYVIVENVPGLWTTGNAGSEVVADLATFGYDIRWDRLSASAVGAPHIRERVFIVAHTSSQRRQQNPRSTHGDESQDARRATPQADQPTSHGERHRERNVANTDSTTRNPPRPTSETLLRPYAEQRPRRRSSSHWRSDPAEGPQPSMGRVAHGVPHRMDRLRTLGNAIVPQVAETIGYWIMQLEQTE